jgi:capsule polysaccharide export protein KpsE/RkpR
MYTLKQLEKLHEEIIKIGAEYVALISNMDPETPDIQVEELKSLADIARKDILKAANVIDFLMSKLIEEEEEE